MKYINVLLIGLFLILIYSCDETIEDTYIETETSLKIDVQITADNFDNKKSIMNASDIDYGFSGARIYSAVNIINPENKLFNYQKIKPHNEPVFSFLEITEGVEFNSLFLEWGYKSSSAENYIMQEPIDLLEFEHSLNNEVFKVKMDEALIQLINNLDSNYDKSIKINITGKSNNEINCSVTLEIPIKLESKEFSPRFELW